MFQPLPAMILICALLMALPAAAKYPDDLPPAEKEIAGTVDPWGLPFSDSLRRFQARFGERPEASFAVSVKHDLVKIWPNKYWFRGVSALSAPAAPAAMQCPGLMAAAGETQAFQIAILPRMAAGEVSYAVEVSLENAQGATAQAFREYFVKTPNTNYPRYGVERWPDPLAPLAANERLPISGLDCAPVWIDVALPADMPATTVQVKVKVTDGKETASLTVPIQVVAGLNLKPKDFPLVAWFRTKWGKTTLTMDQVKDMGALVLSHNLQAMDLLKGRFKPDNTADFDALHQHLAKQGQNVFELDKPGKSFDYKLLYDHVKKQGWLDQSVVYSNVDEPLADVFYSTNVPWYQDFKKQYPGLRVFLASEYHPQMEQGCDIWMTDLSTCGYDPERMRDLKAPTLWNYYCHLPIHVQLRAPLTMAPNMEIDNEAIQQRLALWMSNYYGAKGVFIWAGFAENFPEDFWSKLELSDKPGGYPFGGLHNGNNFLVYPPQTAGGPMLPSLRLKVLRAGMQDLALLREAQRLLDEGKISGARARRLRELLSPVPGLFVHPQYWDRLPETLLARREAILQVLARP
ncbi:MAG: glycoside hydrolase domain-containing protein [Armatimonadota bacterium]